VSVTLKVLDGANERRTAARRYRADISPQGGPRTESAIRAHHRPRTYVPHGMSASQTSRPAQNGIPVELGPVKRLWCALARLVRAARPESGRDGVAWIRTGDGDRGILVGQGSEWWSPIG
jgi:hypothetical protein